MHGLCLAALEQAAMVEEDVHQLPQQVIERLDQLLTDVRVVGRRVELPLGAGPRLERDRQASALARDRQGLPGLGAALLVAPERDRDLPSGSQIEST